MDVTQEGRQDDEEVCAWCAEVVMAQDGKRGRRGGHSGLACRLPGWAAAGGC